MPAVNSSIVASDAHASQAVLLASLNGAHYVAFRLKLR